MAMNFHWRPWTVVVAAAMVGALGACSDGGEARPVAAEQTSTPAPATTTATTATSTTTSTPSAPRVEVRLTCYDSTYSTMGPFTVDDGSDLATVWESGANSCEATRIGGDLTPLEAKATKAAPQSTIETLYGLCGAVGNTNLEPTSDPTYGVTPEEAAELSGMLTLCPKHPRAAQLRAVVTDSRLEAAGELFYDGTLQVGPEVKPGTYAVKKAPEGCYWERLDKAGEIIDNNFVAGSSRVEATIRTSDYSFHSEGCGQWRKVG